MMAFSQTVTMYAPLYDAVVLMIGSGKEVSAIKLIAKISGCGLKKAKEIVFAVKHNSCRHVDHTTVEISL